MSRAMTPDEMKQWMQQWRVAEVELQRQKMRELQAMTEAESARIANYIMWWTPELEYWLPIWATAIESGLVEQQRLFSRLQHAEPGH